MAPVLHPFLSEIPLSPPKARPAPAGTFAAARVCQHNPVAPWSARLANTSEALPKGVASSRRARSDMSRHATVVLA